MNKDYRIFNERKKVEWLLNGSKLLLERTRLNISRNWLANKMGVSAGRLKRLEDGEAVRFAESLTKHYTEVLENVEMKQTLQRLLERVKN